jgi:hypothetical protein
MLLVNLEDAFLVEAPIRYPFRMEPWPLGMFSNVEFHRLNTENRDYAVHVIAANAAAVALRRIEDIDIAYQYYLLSMANLPVEHVYHHPIASRPYKYLFAAIRGVIAYNSGTKTDEVLKLIRDGCHMVETAPRMERCWKEWSRTTRIATIGIFRIKRAEDMYTNHPPDWSCAEKSMVLLEIKWLLSDFKGHHLYTKVVLLLRSYSRDVPTQYIPTEVTKIKTPGPPPVVPLDPPKSMKHVLQTPFIAYTYSSRK